DWTQRGSWNAGGFGAAAGKATGFVGVRTIALYAESDLFLSTGPPDSTDRFRAHWTRLSGQSDAVAPFRQKTTSTRSLPLSCRWQHYQLLISDVFRASSRVWALDFALGPLNFTLDVANVEIFRGDGGRDDGQSAARDGARDGLRRVHGGYVGR